MIVITGIVLNKFDLQLIKLAHQLVTIAKALFYFNYAAVYT